MDSSIVSEFSLSVLNFLSENEFHFVHVHTHVALVIATAWPVQRNSTAIIHFPELNDF